VACRTKPEDKDSAINDPKGAFPWVAARQCLSEGGQTSKTDYLLQSKPWSGLLKGGKYERTRGRLFPHGSEQWRKVRSPCPKGDRHKSRPAKNRGHSVERNRSGAAVKSKKPGGTTTAPTTAGEAGALACESKKETLRFKSLRNLKPLKAQGRLPWQKRPRKKRRKKQTGGGVNLIVWETMWGHLTMRRSAWQNGGKKGGHQIGNVPGRPSSKKRDCGKPATECIAKKVVV